MKKLSLFHWTIIIAISVAFFWSFLSASGMHMKYMWLEDIFEQYLKDKNDISDNWMNYMTILSTIFAVFFVYSWFKIDKDLREVQEKWYSFLEKIELKYQEKITQIEVKWEEEKNEINTRNEQEKEELKNELAFIKIISYIERQINEEWNHDDAIIRLNELLKDEKNSNNTDRYNQVIILVSKAYLWKWMQKKDIADLSEALVFANEAIEDATDPYKNKLIELFNEHWKGNKNEYDKDISYS